MPNSNMESVEDFIKSVKQPDEAMIVLYDNGKVLEAALERREERIKVEARLATSKKWLKKHEDNYNGDFKQTFLYAEFKHDITELEHQLKTLDGQEK